MGSAYIVDEVPEEELEITYPSGAVVDLGKELTPTQVKDEPEVKWKADRKSLYTLLMVDPDAPSRENPILGEICHWMVVNIPGNKVSKGQTVAEYVGSGPPEKSGLHRYVFFVFKQKEKITTEEFIPNNSREGRLNVKTRDYISKYNLGNPIATNFYQAQYDDYVPILRSQFEKKEE